MYICVCKTAKYLTHHATSDCTIFLPENARQSWNLKSFGGVFSAAAGDHKLCSIPICRTVLLCLVNMEHDARKTCSFFSQSRSAHVKDSVLFFHGFLQQVSTITSQQRKVLAGAFALHIGEGQVSLTRKPSFQTRQAFTRCGRKPWESDGHLTVWI